MSETRDDLREALACGDCGKALPTGVELYELTCDECLAAERDRVMAEARNHREPPPPPIPVRKRYYLTECRDCGWIGSSEQCDGDDESVVCPVCYSWHCEETPSEADTAKHGEAVMQRILAAEAGQKDALAQVSALQAEVERLQKVEGEREAAVNAAAILLPFVDMAAGEGLEWSEQECGSPRMDAADLCVQAAEALGFELGDDQYTALLKQGENAIREAAETSHAR